MSSQNGQTYWHELQKMATNVWEESVKRKNGIRKFWNIHTYSFSGAPAFGQGNNYSEAVSLVVCDPFYERELWET